MRCSLAGSLPRTPDSMSSFVADASAILCRRARTHFPLTGPRFHFMGSSVSPHGVLSFPALQTSLSFLGISVELAQIHRRDHRDCSDAGIVARFVSSQESSQAVAMTTSRRVARRRLARNPKWRMRTKPLGSTCAITVGRIRYSTSYGFGPTTSNRVWIRRRGLFEQELVA